MGKSQIDITLKIETCGLDSFTVFGINAYNFVKPASALFAERQAILGKHAGQVE